MTDTRNFRYTNAIPPLGTRFVDDRGFATEEYRRFLEGIVTQLGGQGGDYLDDLRTLAEASNLRELEELRALIEQQAARIADNASQLEQIKQDSERQLAVLVQEISTAIALRPFGPLAEKSTVDTPDITQGAVTNADSTGATASNASWTTEDSFSQVELARHTQVLSSGSTAILDCRFTKTEIVGSSTFYLSSNGLSPPFSPTRDVLLRLVRDPDGSADVLRSVFVAEGWNGNTSPFGSFADLADANFIYEDDGHSGGSTTWALDLVSYNTGTTTSNPVKYALNNVTRTIYCLEAKR